MTNQINNQSIIPSTDVIQLTLTLKMITAQVVETSVTVNNNSPIQDYVHPDDQTQPTFEIVFTEEKLFRANIANSDLCYLCLETNQDLKHMLVSCQFVSEFWEAFLHWYKSHVSIGLELSTINILYGITGNNHLSKLTNHLLLLGKYHIYCCSITEEPLLLSVYLTIGGKQSRDRKTNCSKR